MRCVYLVAIAALLFACATSNLNGNYVLKNKATRSIVVLGVQPDYRVIVTAGHIKANAFQFDGFALPAFSITPVDGYIVAALDATKGDTRYAITQVTDTNHGNHIYTPCGNTSPTFTVKPGVITYLGSYYFREGPDGLSRTISYDVTSAREYIRTHYRRLTGLPFIIEHASDMHIINEPCGTPIFIFLPIR